MKARVLVAIVNYRCAELVIDCLRSLESDAASIRAVVVDNASGDGSGARIADAIVRHGIGAWAEVVELQQNDGYAAGNNAAVARALETSHGEWPEFVWYLNPDTYVRPGALAALLAFLARRPDVGIVGSRLEDPDGTQQSSRYRFPSIASEFESGVRLGVVSRLLSRHVVAPPLTDVEEEVDWVAGASMLVRRDVFRDVSEMDARYFLYYEETDFCLAAKRKGWRVWYVPSSRVVHLVGKSTGVTTRDAAPRRLPAYWLRSRRRCFVKNHGRLYALVADGLWLLGYLTWRLRRPLQGKPDLDPPHLMGDFVRHNFLPGGA